MIWVDYVILGIIALSSLISLVRGFVREALSLVTWICAFFVASHFYPYIVDYFTYFQDEILRISVAVVILFIATLLVGGIVNYVIGRLVQHSGLSGTDRLLGVCFGLLRGVLVVSAMLFFLDTFTPFSQSSDWKQSELIPHFHSIIRWFFDYLQNSSSLLNQRLPL